MVRAITSIGQSVENIAKCVSVPSVTESAVKSIIVQPVTASARSLNPSGVEAALIPSPVVAQVKGSQGSSKSVASVPPIAPLPGMSPQVTSDQTHISGVEDIVRQLAARMEVFFSQIQPTLIPPTSQGSMLLPGSSHPKRTRVPSQHE